MDGQKIVVPNLKSMNANILFYGVVVLIALPTLFCSADYNHNSRTYSQNYPSYNQPKEDIGNAWRQLKNQLADIKHEMNNHESEIRIFEEKLQNQETIMDSLRDQLKETTQSQKDLIKGNSLNLESKITSLETTAKNLISDIKQIKDQSNDSVTILGQYKQKITELEKIIESQNQHMTHLEEAIASLMELIQAKDTNTKSPQTLYGTTKPYKVQPGDSLEKIARYHKVSVQAIKDCNSLNKDLIVVGQTLQIPVPYATN